MHHITVRQALELPELQHLEVLAGESGLDRVLRNVTVIEVPDPVYWVKEGDLLLTTFYGLRGDSSGQVSLARRVAEMMAAGICFHPGTETRLAPELRSAADEMGLPLLRMPKDMPYATVISAVLQAILNRQAYLLGRSTEINSMLTKAILNGAETAEIVSALARLVKSPVALLDSSLNLVAGDPYSEVGREFLAQGVPKLLDLDIFRPGGMPGESLLFVELPVKGRLVRVGVQAVMIRSSVYGYVTVWEVLKHFDDVDGYAIAHASTALALDFIRRLTIDEQRQRLANELCDRILAGDPGQDESLEKRGEVLGLNVRAFNVVIAVEVSTSDQARHEDPATGWMGDAPGLLAEIRRVAGEHYPGCLVAGEDKRVTLVVAAGSGPDRKAEVLGFARRVKEACQRHMGKACIRVGVGGFARCPGELHNSHREAKASLEMALSLGEGAGVASFEDLGVYRLLWNIPRTIQLTRYLEAVLPLAGQGDEVLLETLEAYLECNKSVLKASKRLYVHPNTVKYRIQKARDTWGLHITEDKACADTLLAIKIRRLLKTNPS
ncbi:MAG: PucR family transcriptional regulator ligand-binding domain-containing protein [Bacillota bacterium]|jgi:sugar diacid utilization regulator